MKDFIEVFVKDKCNNAIYKTLLKKEHIIFFKKENNEIEIYNELNLYCIMEKSFEQIKEYFKDDFFKIICENQKIEYLFNPMFIISLKKEKNIQSNNNYIARMVSDSFLLIENNENLLEYECIKNNFINITTIKNENILINKSHIRYISEEIKDKKFILSITLSNNQKYYIINNYIEIKEKILGTENKEFEKFGLTKITLQ